MAQEKTNFATRNAIGKLFVATTMSTDPAQTLGFTSSLIATVRAALIQKLEENIKGYEDIPGLLNTILKFIVYQWTEQGLPKEYQDEIDKRIGEIFQTDSMTKWGLEVYRDIIFCDDLTMRWKKANLIYIQAPAAWAVSNDIIADIHRQLMEIIVRHDLMMFPKDASFNIDEGGMDYGAIHKAIEQQRVRGES
jgi:hypothetical protein